MDQAFPVKTVAGTSHLFPAKALVATRPTENSGTVAIVIVLLAVDLRPSLPPLRESWVSVLPITGRRGKGQAARAGRTRSTRDRNCILAGSSLCGSGGSESVPARPDYCRAIASRDRKRQYVPPLDGTSSNSGVRLLGGRSCAMMCFKSRMMMGLDE